MRRLPPLLDTPGEGDTGTPSSPPRLTQMTDNCSFQDVPYLQDGRQFDYSYTVPEGRDSAPSDARDDQNEAPRSSLQTTSPQGGVTFDYEDLQGSLQASNNNATANSDEVHERVGWNNESGYYGEHYTYDDPFEGASYEQLEDEKRGAYHEDPHLEFISPEDYGDAIHSNAASQRDLSERNKIAVAASEEREYLGDISIEEVPSVRIMTPNRDESSDDEEISAAESIEQILIDDSILGKQRHMQSTPNEAESKTHQKTSRNEANNREAADKKMGATTWPAPLDETAHNSITELPSSDDKILEAVQRTGELMVRIVTWNQQAKDPPPPRTLVDHLIPRRRFHIIAFCTQECENSILKSFFSPSKAKWETAACIAVGPDYDIIRSQTLQASHSIIFVHRALLPLISNIKASVVPTGFMDLLGNKGGIGISFNVGTSSMCIVNAHLAASQFAVQKRIDDYVRISNMIPLRMGSSRRRRLMKNAIDIVKSRTRSGNQISPVHKLKPNLTTKGKTLFHMFDFVFLAGDLNFRSNGTRAIVDSLLKIDAHEILLHNDQLSLLLQIDPVFNGFEEGPLNFRPTYKFDKELDQYDTSKKQRIPSWTDRILYKRGSSLDVVTYSSATEIRSSDHRPVCGSFRCKIKHKI